MRIPFLSTDFRAIARSLGRAKAFTLVTVATLALGIGAAAAISHTADRILFRGPALPRNVFVVGAVDPAGGGMWWRFDVHLRAYRERPDVFAELAPMAKRTGNVSVGGEPVATVAWGITANLLPMLGVRQALGATPGHLSRLVLGRAALLATLGIGTGIAVSSGLAGYLQSVLFKTPQVDVLVLAAVAGLVLAMALGACTAPALRAARTRIAQLLRSE